VKERGYKLGKTSTSRSTSPPPNFYVKEKKSYVFKKSSGASLSGDEMVEFYTKLTRNIDHLDRGRLRRGRLDHVEETHRRIGDRVQLVGDDLS